MENVILTQTQVDELMAKSYALDGKIDRIQSYLVSGKEKENTGDTNNFGDTNIDEVTEMVKTVREKAGYDDILADYTLAVPSKGKIEIGSLVTYIILDSEGISERLVGQEKTIMIVQKNYSNARPKNYAYVSLDTEAGRAFYGTKTGDVVSYAVGDKTFKTLVISVDNEYSLQSQSAKTKTR